MAAELPKDVFRVDYVVMEASGNRVDNNATKDFQLPVVGGITEQELTEKRAREYEAAEQERKVLLVSEEAKIAAKVRTL